MNILKIVFVLLFLFSMGCAVKGERDKRRNIGFCILAVMVAIGDCFSFVALNVQNIKAASNVFLPYYILHAWSLFVFLIMVILIDRSKRYVISVVLSAVVCIYQTYLVISHYLGARIFSLLRSFTVWLRDSRRSLHFLYGYPVWQMITSHVLCIIRCGLTRPA